jgi:acetolactate synthase-1/2/3 large subunit
LPPTDFAALARALGAEGITIRTPGELSTLDVASICARKGPTLLDVYVDPDEVPPMSVRMRVLDRAGLLNTDEARIWKGPKGKRY